MRDVRVEVVAEGEAGEIDQFIEKVGQKMDVYIKQLTDFDSPATGEFSDFGVRG